MNAAAPTSHFSKVVLNIGGIRFETSRATLCKVPRSFFTLRLLAGAASVSRDSDGAYFVDRDGRLFHHILSWLRAFNPTSPLPRSTNLLVSFRNGQHDKVSDITGLPLDVYANRATHRSLVQEVEFYGLIPLLFALDPTLPAVADYKPAAASANSSKEELDRAIAQWDGESNVPDLATVKLYQSALTDPSRFSQPDAQATAVREAVQAVSDFDGLGGFGPLLDGVKASLLGKCKEVSWVAPAGFDIDKHGDAIAAELKRRHGLSVDILGNQLQLRPIV